MWLVAMRLRTTRSGLSAVAPAGGLWHGVVAGELGLVDNGLGRSLEAHHATPRVALMVVRVILVVLAHEHEEGTCRVRVRLQVSCCDLDSR